MSITLLSQAIHQAFSTDPTLPTVITGGLWTGEVPEGTAPPYAWLDLTDTNINPIFEDYFEQSIITVHIYAIGAAAAEAAAVAFRATFDFTTLNFSSPASNIWVKPRRYRLVPERTRWKDGTLMYRAVLTYDILVQKPQP